MSVANHFDPINICQVLKLLLGMQTLDLGYSSLTTQELQPFSLGQCLKLQSLSPQHHKAAHFCAQLSSLPVAILYCVCVCFCVFVFVFVCVLYFHAHTTQLSDDCKRGISWQIFRFSSLQLPTLKLCHCILASLAAKTWTSALSAQQVHYFCFAPFISQFCKLGNVLRGKKKPE